jgi:hypothetical protein
MLQPARWVVVASLALFTVASMLPSSAWAQNGNKHNRRKALMASRPYAPVQYGGRGTPNPADVTAVTQAYKLLAQADHDYDGHRAKAMKHLSQAGRVLGVMLKGDGRNPNQQQVSSDELLKQAQTMLQKMGASGVSGNRHTRAMTHVQNAMSELNTALSIK